jgi:hypothetical protein
VAPRRGDFRLNTKARRDRVRGGRQPLQIALEVRVIDLDEIAAVERIDAGLDLRAQCFQLQRIFLPAPLHARAINPS